MIGSAGGVSLMARYPYSLGNRLDQMESVNSASGDPHAPVETAEPSLSESSDKWFSERFESLLPKIQERWPDVARQTLEATKGSLDEVVRVISQQSTAGSSSGIREQLEELFNMAGDRTRDFAESLEPLEKQLEDLLDELNSSVRPRIERPVRQRPLLSVAMAAGIGVLLGVILAGGRRS